MAVFTSIKANLKETNKKEQMRVIIAALLEMAILAQAIIYLEVLVGEDTKIVYIDSETDWRDSLIRGHIPAIVLDKATMRDVLSLPEIFFAHMASKQLTTLLLKGNTKQFLFRLDEARALLAAKKLSYISLKSNSQFDLIPSRFHVFIDIVQTLRNFCPNHANFCTLFGLNSQCFSRALRPIAVELSNALDGEFSRDRLESVSMATSADLDEGLVRVISIYQILSDYIVFNSDQAVLNMGRSHHKIVQERVDQIASGIWG